MPAPATLQKEAAAVGGGGGGGADAASGLDYLCSSVPGACILAACVRVVDSYRGMEQGIQHISQELGIPVERARELFAYAASTVDELHAPRNIEAAALRSLVQEAVRHIKHEEASTMQPPLSCLDHCRVVLNYNSRLVAMQVRAAVWPV